MDRYSIILGKEPPSRKQEPVEESPPPIKEGFVGLSGITGISSYPTGLTGMQSRGYGYTGANGYTGIQSNGYTGIRYTGFSVDPTPETISAAGPNLGIGLSPSQFVLHSDTNVLSLTDSRIRTRQSFVETLLMELQDPEEFGRQAGADLYRALKAAEEVRKGPPKQSFFKRLKSFFKA